MQRFIHILSHDMREPLNTIVNFSGLLAEHPVLSVGREGKYLEHLSTGARRMRFLLDDLLHYVRLDRAEARDIEVDMNAVVADVRNDLAAQIGLAGATVNATPLPLVRGDTGLIRVVLQNLVSNAIKFVAPGSGPVILICDESEVPEWWRLTVRDNGIGIPEEALPSLFTPFTRLNTRDNYAGTGLGLATCKRVAEMHGGRMEVTSVPGRGSRFTLVLPRRRH
jgi:signal transduction histidine kinase